jgi:hypothetical protein
MSEEAGTATQKPGKVVFYHQFDSCAGYSNKGGFTFAVFIPESFNFNYLSNCFKFDNGECSDPIPMNIGWALCSDKDQYCRAKGRQTCLDRMKSTPVLCNRVIFEYSKEKKATIFVDLSAAVILVDKLTGEKSLVDIDFRLNVKPGFTAISEIYVHNPQDFPESADKEIEGEQHDQIPENTQSHETVQENGGNKPSVDEGSQENA